MFNMNAVASGLGITVVASWVLLFFVIILIMLMRSKLDGANRKFNFTIFSAICIIGILWFAGAFGNLVPWKPTENSTIGELEQMDWQINYENKAKMEFDNYETYLENTVYYDYEDPYIVQAANEIKTNSESSKEAIQKTLDFVYSNIKYTSTESHNVCLSGTAPEILRSGTGQCDTQSLVTISILRKIGIIAKPVGGCIMVKPNCYLQSLFTQAFDGIKTPKIEPIGEISPQDISFPRGSYDRKNSYQSGLHAWVTTWLPDEGWINLEVTSGKFIDYNCFNYHVEIFPEDDQKEEICLSKSWNYARACQESDLEKLNAFGIGLANEVNP